MKQYHAGHIECMGRHFYAVECEVQLTAVIGYNCGPWAIIENNGGGMKPILILGGISGGKKNAERRLANFVAAIVKARLEEVIKECWVNYYANVDAGRMRQRPGRSEYEIALKAAGLLGPTDADWRKFFFEEWGNPDSKTSKTIRRVQIRMEKQRAISHPKNPPAFFVPTMQQLREEKYQQGPSRIPGDI